MNLQEALRQIAAAGNLDADELIAYAAEDQVGGRDTGHWSGMSTFADEGKVLYALIRAMRPARVVEIGVASGGTSTHILSALEANGFGTLYSVDVEASCGLDIPEHLRHRWTFVVGDALTTTLPDQANFCFEDGSHAYEFTRDMVTRLKGLNPRIIMSHDYYTHEVYGGFFVKQGFDEALGEGANGVKIDDAFTGLGYWFNPDWSPKVKTEATPSVADVSPIEAVPEADSTVPVQPEEETPKPAPKPSRKRASKNA